jgi:hypothetical protein
MEDARPLDESIEKYKEGGRKRRRRQETVPVGRINGGGFATDFWQGAAWPWPLCDK